MESLFWLTVFTLFFNEDVHAPPETEEITRLRRECSKYVFPGNVSGTKGNRTSLIRNPCYLPKYSRWLGESFDQFLTPLFRFFSMFGPVYTEIYTSLGDETPPKTKIRAPEMLYYAAIIAFEACQESSRSMEIRPRKSKKLEQGNNNAPQQPESNTGDQRSHEPKPNDQQPQAPELSEQRPLEYNSRKREHEDEEEYKVLNTTKYLRRE